MTKQRGPGRPRKKKSEIKAPDPIRSIRVPDDEWESWQKAAGELPVSQWLRKLANKAAKRKP